MQKIILDTNVLVSALIAHSIPTRILYELTAVSYSDYLITGNTQGFTINEFEYTKILTPGDYWKSTSHKTTSANVE